MSNAPIADEQIAEQLMLLRDITKRTGILHDAQVLQLKMWPLILLPFSKSAKAKIDTTKYEITFEVDVHGKLPKDADTHFGRLNEAVKWLLGKEWLVRVKVRGKQVYRGPRI
jgi:hypothetical protein